MMTSDKDPLRKDVDRLRAAVCGYSSPELRKIEDLAQNGSCRSAVFLADETREGGVYLQNYEGALRWYGVAEELGCVDGIHGAGVIYMNLNQYHRALSKFQHAAAHGYGPSMNQIGIMYFHGIGVSADPRTAEKWWIKGAFRGHLWSMRNFCVKSIQGHFGPFKVPIGLLLVPLPFFLVPVVLAIGASEHTLKR